MRSRTISCASHDLAGARTRITCPDGFYVTYARDATEDVTDIYESGSFDLAHYSYDDLGERTGITRGNGVSTGYGYDALSRLTALSHTLASGNYNQSLGFTRNAAGQITGRTLSNSAYEWTGAYTVTRGYAPNGLNQLTTSGPYSLAYDARGNLTSDSLHSYGYTPTNQLTTYSNGGATAGLYYDPLGRLALTSSSAPSTTQFAYAGDQLISEYDGSTPANLLRRYVPGASGADDPIVWYEGSSTGDRRWLLDDERGSVVGVTNASGALMGNPNTYDEYGNPGGSNQGRFQYTGQLWIPEIGLYHYKARTYSPTLGRFMQTDPIGYKSDLDLYAYVSDDPIDKTDPSGEDAISDALNAISNFIKALVNAASSSSSGTGNSSSSNANNGGTVSELVVTAKKSPVLKHNPGVPPASPAVTAALMCIQTCTGAEIIVTSTSEHASVKRRADDPHYRGRAADFKSPVDPKIVGQCEADCGAAYEINEYQDPSPNSNGDHYHFSLDPGVGGYTGPYYPQDLRGPLN